jgi:hypothetical protein
MLDNTTAEQREMINRQAMESLELADPNSPLVKRHKQQLLADRHMSELESAFPEQKPSMTMPEYRQAVAHDAEIQAIDAEIAEVYTKARADKLGSLELNRLLKPLTDKKYKRLEALEAGPKVTPNMDSWEAVEVSFPGIKSWTTMQGLDGSQQAGVVYRNLLGRIHFGKPMSDAWLRKWTTVEAAEQLIPLIKESMKGMTDREAKLQNVLSNMVLQLQRRVLIAQQDEYESED